MSRMLLVNEAVLKQALEALVWIEQCSSYSGQYVRASCNKRAAEAIPTLRTAIEAAEKQEPVAWTAREIELIDGMIQVQMDHAERCDHIANRSMAEKQKGWDMERVALLQKIRATPPAAPVQVDHCIWARNGNTPCPHTAPQRQWVGLTEDALKGIFNEPDLPAFVVESARAIDAWLREKNGYTR